MYERTYDDESTEPAGTMTMSTIDHRETPEDKDEAEYSEENAAYHVHYLVAESLERDGQDVHDRA